MLASGTHPRHPKTNSNDNHRKKILVTIAVLEESEYSTILSNDGYGNSSRNRKSNVRYRS